MSNQYFLGLDLSTQQLKCTLINDSHDILFEDAVNFDRDLSEFGTTHGVIQDGNEATTPTLLWVKALDMLLTRLKATPYIHRIRGISGAGQQHGSVYWSLDGIEVLAKLDPTETLAAQLVNAFAIEHSPVWQDTSTTKECRSLETFVGGPEKLSRLTGSRAYERFTGNQIAKIYHTRREEYEITAHISLVSSFIATLFLGDLGPVDASEGSGTNLMNIQTHRWQDGLLEHCGGPDLRKKLGLEPVEGGIQLGKISPYFVHRYGFDSDCAIMPFTGDNSATLASMNLCEGDCVVSLGTSDTVLVYLKKDTAKTTTDSHLMAHPTDPQGFMGMLCYKNGSLTRQHIRDTYANGSWDTFNRYLQQQSNGQMGFYYWMQEIIPFAKGIYRFQDGKLVDEFEDPTMNIRAIVESQFISMRIRLERMTQAQITRVLATGGAAANTALLQVLSDVLGLPVYKQKGMNSASLGGALLAKYGTVSHQQSFNDLVREHNTIAMELVCEPNRSRTAWYGEMLAKYVKLEESITKSV
ncbi:hypothetical protein DFQ28_000738 [Apophysomyces sp. BC1034]|nr:hypothetical protein DFQ30_001148 [Apophysomyces sp. BC1015]KAG0167456.1 hypothetical protein DFQ29_000399 [Apophysomyces sp. BC1021]KAG0183851.1 hypothetical protein DFQ28_000738 [Apophysomyces sp. BC1034]